MAISTEGPRPGRPPRFRRRLRTLLIDQFQQTTQAVIAIGLIGVLISLQFASGASPELSSGTRTLAIAVVAFYFGRRLTSHEGQTEATVELERKVDTEVARKVETAMAEAEAELQQRRIETLEALEEYEARAAGRPDDPNDIEGTKG